MRRGLGFALVLGVVLAAAPTAQAAFHLMKVTEVDPGTALAPDRAFVELQMLAPGQTQVNGHDVVVYNAAGAVAATVVMNGNVANGDGQRTILLGDIDVTNRDFDANIGTLVSPAGGAVCFPDATPADCVAWGNFAAPGALPAPVGTPVAAGGIPDGSSITRDISTGCPTALDAADDTDDSGADFAITTPSPRSNSAVPTETLCGGGAGPSLVLSGRKTQKAGGKVVVKAKCTDQDCSLAATGRSKLKGGANGSSATASGRKAVKLKKDTASAAAGETVKLKLRHAKSAKRRVKRAVRGGGKAKAVVKVTATGAEGATTERFKARLKK